MSAPDPAISVVVATHDRAERLEALLAGLRGQTLPAGRFEVIVVDDGSTDATPDVLRREEERGALRLTALRKREAGGPGAARNRGWPLARAPVVAFTDDDCVPAPGWLGALLAASTGDDRAIVRGPTRPSPAEAHLLGPYSKTVDIANSSPHYETCNIAYPRALLEAVGGFDESYRVAGEDGDLGWRAAEAGGNPVFAPDALVHHAVFERGPIGALGDAALATEGVRVYKRHRALRSHLAGGLFFNRSHPMLMLAAAGVLAACRRPAALALCLPYAHNVRGRCLARGATARQAPWFVLFDVVQTGATIRGAAKTRLPML